MATTDSQAQQGTACVPPTAGSPVEQPDRPDRLSKALLRKRERDRRNQQQKRERERRLVEDLKAKISQLERELAAANADRGRGPLSLHSLICNGCRGRSCSTAGSQHDTDLASTNGSIVAASSPPVSEPFRTSHATVSLSVLKKLLDTPEWLRTPLWNVDRPNANFRFLERGQGFVPLMAQLRATPSMAEKCPPVPKAIDLLFGGSSNVLANFVVDELAGLPLLSPEKFASCWHIYLYCRWLVWPSQDTFSRLPTYFRPTPLQLVQEHHLAFDLILWPQMRDNLIRYGSKYELESVIGLLCCTYRIRGTFTKDFITREYNGEPQPTDEFYAQFMDISNWGILERFWKEYPDLMEGIDSSLMLREENLMPP
ncbi:uncharacterized protein PV09_04138 [Verruconis gallopava]|uniref:BZIP domain-containing protein n=1 Tax=Verruconis gallopava TaxID=253628 RepID=A0A0D1XQQ8_9PEZI|nr:uncharacterized protein PV09_04138 [Verruconis gallopava]KIW04976.1 hypothetical protein PV09_04138 [Verruconis gallopava]